MEITKTLTLEDITQTVTTLAKAYDLKQVHLFGSYARGEQREQSDIDLRIDMPPTKGLEFWGLWQDLEDHLGKKIDLLENKYIPDDLREHIQDYEVLIYEDYG